MSGSAKKVAYAIQENIRAMCGTPHRHTDTQPMPRSNRQRVGMLTLTVGDQRRSGFVGVEYQREASRRINSLLTGWLRALFVRSVIVTERHKSGMIHFHLIVESRCDLATRGGAWTPALRSIHRQLRKRLPGYGFGRAELTPLRKTGDALAFYVAKYVSKNLAQRRPCDVGARLVRYSGWNKRHLRAADFSWAHENASEWRRNAALCAELGGFGADAVEAKAGLSECFGSRWAYRITGVIGAASREMGDDHRENVLTIRSLMAGAEVNPEWRRWRDEEQAANYYEQVDAEREARLAKPEPDWTLFGGF